MRIQSFLLSELRRGGFGHFAGCVDDGLPALGLSGSESLGTVEETLLEVTLLVSKASLWGPPGYIWV